MDRAYPADVASVSRSCRKPATTPLTASRGTPASRPSRSRHPPARAPRVARPPRSPRPPRPATRHGRARPRRRERSPSATSLSSVAYPRARTSRSSSRSSAGRRGPQARAVGEGRGARVQRAHLLAGERGEHRPPARREVRGEPHADIGDQGGTPRRALLDDVEHVAAAHDGEVRALAEAIGRGRRRAAGRVGRAAAGARSRRRARTPRCRGPSAAPRGSAARSRAPRAW